MSSLHEKNDDVEMVTLSSLAENMVYRLPGCSDTMIRKTLQESYRDFCQNTNVFLSKVDVRTNDLSETIEVSSCGGGFIETVESVRLNGAKLNHRDFRAKYCGSCVKISLLGNFGIKTNSESEVSVKFIEIPDITSEKIPRWMLQKYGDAIVSGALFRLFSMSNKPWSDPQQALYERERLLNFATLARINSAQDETMGTSAVDCAVDTSWIL